MNIQERPAVFFQRLEAAPPASSAEEAMALVCRLIEEVEDEFCPLPRASPPPTLRFTGRMYAPQKDRIRCLQGGGLMAAADGIGFFVNQMARLLSETCMTMQLF